MVRLKLEPKLLRTVTEHLAPWITILLRETRDIAIVSKNHRLTDRYEWSAVTEGYLAPSRWIAPEASCKREVGAYADCARFVQTYGTVYGTKVFILASF